MGVEADVVGEGQADSQTEPLGACLPRFGFDEVEKGGADTGAPAAGQDREAAYVEAAFLGLEAHGTRGGTVEGGQDGPTVHEGLAHVGFALGVRPAWRFQDPEVFAVGFLRDGMDAWNVVGGRRAEIKSHEVASCGR